jgi:hypothetical protein
MANFHIYGDESGKLSGKADITSFCGYVGHISAWAQFADIWRNCRLKWQVPPVHMARIMYPDGKDDDWKKVKTDWGTSWEKKRDLMLKEFADIVRSSDIMCVGAIVDCKHFRHLADTDPLFKEAQRDPIHMAFHTFLMRGIEKTNIVDDCSPISIVIDDDPEFAMKVYEQIETLKTTFPHVKKRVHAVSFVDDFSYPGVQAADMIAYEGRKIMVEKMTNPDATSDLYDDLTFHRVHQPQFYNAKILDQLRATNPLKGQTNATQQP